MRRSVTLAAIAAGALAIAAAAWGGAGSRQVQMLDDCEPTSFNAVLGEDGCVKDGGTTFGEFIGQLVSQGRAPAWRFAPERLGLAAGGTVTAVNRGGEFHTFTEVAAFGGGCIAVLNELLGLTPVPECAGFPAILGATGAPPGDSVTVQLGPGVHRFECLIHPWMRTTVTAS
jgi:plastocyanin